MHAIAVTDLRKEFRVSRHEGGIGQSIRRLVRPEFKVETAVDGLTFAIHEGERVAFIGPNGAGKSTTIKMLTGILRPSSGSIRILGRSPWEDRRMIAYEIGTVFGQRSQLRYHLPALDSFRLLGHIYDQDPVAHRQRMDELIHIFAIESLMTKPVRQLSLGERMRCEIVGSLLHRPKIIFLDEPTIGLDLTAKALIRDYVKRASINDGCTVLLTSHDTGDMEEVCERVMVINHGRLVIDQSVSTLRSTVISEKIMTIKTSESHVDLPLEVARVVSRRPHELKIAIDLGKTTIGLCIQEIMKHGTVVDLSIEDPPMEEIIKAIYQRGRDYVWERTRS